MLATGLVSESIEPVRATQLIDLRELAARATVNAQVIAAGRVEQVLPPVKPMLRQTSTLQSMAVRATDGTIGNVCDVYLDPLGWTVRYLVVATHDELPGRYALIPPSAVDAVDWLAQVVKLKIAIEIIGKSPAMDIPRWLYWGDNSLSGNASAAAGQRACWLLDQGWDECDPLTLAILRPSGRPQPTLHSAAALAVLQAEGVDGALGDVIDLLFDERTWALRYLLLDTTRLVPESHLLISTQWIDRVSTHLGAVYTFLSCDAACAELRNAAQSDDRLH